MIERMSPDLREIRNSLQDVVCAQLDAADVPAALVRAVGASPLTPTQKRIALGTIRNWANYARDSSVPGDPFAIRYHVPRFAAQEFGEVKTREPLQAVEISSLGSYEGHSYTDIIAAHTDPAILTDADVAIVGGAARLALKMHADIDIKSELPVSDVDVVITADTPDIAVKAGDYGVDLADAKVVDGAIGKRLGELVTNFDCTMNQVAVYDGKLLFTQSALDDVKSGDIRLLAKNDPLFGSEGMVMPDGNVYIHRTGFYRGLGFLLRKKGERLIVSAENVEREKDAIGRYWQVLLFVKLLPIKDEQVRYEAIGHWHDVAKRIGSTQAENPLAFLEELMAEYPETAAGKNRGNYDKHAQARWIIGKLVARGVERLHGPEVSALPETYTQADITLAPSFADYDYEIFMRYVRDLHDH